MKKTTSWLLLVIFISVESLGYAQGIQISGSTLNSSEVKMFERFEPIEIPESIGTIEESYSAGHSTVIHIQDAHGQVDAQRNIEKILKYLHENYGVKTIFLEGGLAGEISPDLLRFFRDEALNDRIADKLVEQGAAGGSGLYLLHSNPRVNAYGVEAAELYKKNLHQFRDLYRQKNVADTFLHQVKTRLTTLGPSHLNRELYRFLRDWLLFQDSRQNIFAHLGILDRYAKEYLRVNLHEPRNQFDYPQLVRYFKLSNLESEISKDSEMGLKLTEERKRLGNWLKENGFEGVASVVVILSSLDDVQGAKNLRDPSASPQDDGSLRASLERFYEQVHPKGFRFTEYPAVTRILGQRILHEELDSLRLFEEMDRVTEKILSRLIQSDEEKSFIELQKSVRLLEKLFSLELTREEYLHLKNDLVDVIPSKVFFQLIALDSRHPEEPTLVGDEGSKALDQLYRQAVRFYETAIQREKIIFENVIQGMRQTDSDKTVLITGGFHQEGIRSLVTKKGLSYVSINPRISQINDNSKYVDRMMLKNTLSVKDSTVPQLHLDRISGKVMASEFGSAEAEHYRSEVRNAVRSVVGPKAEPKTLGPAWHLHGFRDASPDSIEAVAAKHGIPNASLVSPAPRSEMRPVIETSSGSRRAQRVISLGFAAVLGLTGLNRHDAERETVPPVNSGETQKEMRYKDSGERQSLRLSRLKRPPTQTTAKYLELSEELEQKIKSLVPNGQLRYENDRVVIEREDGREISLDERQIKSIELLLNSWIFQDRFQLKTEDEFDTKTGQWLGSRSYWVSELPIWQKFINDAGAEWMINLIATLLPGSPFGVSEIGQIRYRLIAGDDLRMTDYFTLLEDLMDHGLKDNLSSEWEPKIRAKSFDEGVYFERVKKFDFEAEETRRTLEREAGSLKFENPETTVETEQPAASAFAYPSPPFTTLVPVFVPPVNRSNPGTVGEVNETIPPSDTEKRTVVIERIQKTDRGIEVEARVSPGITHVNFYEADEVKGPYVKALTVPVEGGKAVYIVNPSQPKKFFHVGTSRSEIRRGMITQVLRLTALINMTVRLMAQEVNPAVANEIVPPLPHAVQSLTLYEQALKNQLTNHFSYVPKFDQLILELEKNQQTRNALLKQLNLSRKEEANLLGLPEHSRDLYEKYGVIAYLSKGSVKTVEQILQNIPSETFEGLDRYLEFEWVQYDQLGRENSTAIYSKNTVMQRMGASRNEIVHEIAHHFLYKLWQRNPGMIRKLGAAYRTNPSDFRYISEYAMFGPWKEKINSRRISTPPKSEEDLEGIRFLRKHAPEVFGEAFAEIASVWFNKSEKLFLDQQPLQSAALQRFITQVSEMFIQKKADKDFVQFYIWLPLRNKFRYEVEIPSELRVLYKGNENGDGNQELIYAALRELYLEIYEDELKKIRVSFTTQSLNPTERIQFWGKQMMKMGPITFLKMFPLNDTNVFQRMRDVETLSNTKIDYEDEELEEQQAPLRSELRQRLLNSALLTRSLVDSQIAVAIAAERILREKFEEHVADSLSGFDPPAQREKEFKAIVEAIKRGVLPELYIKTKFADSLTPDFKRAVQDSVDVSDELVNAFEKTFLRTHNEFAVNYLAVPAGVRAGRLESLLTGLKPVIDRNASKVLVLAVPYDVPSELQDRISRKFEGRVFLFGNVSAADYPLFLENLIRGNYSRIEAPLAQAFRARAAALYKASSKEPAFSLPELLASSQASGAESVFSQLLLQGIPRQFVEEGGFGMNAADLLSARISLSLVSSGKPTAEEIKQVAADFLLIEPKDSQGRIIRLRINPDRIGALVTLVHAIRAYQKLEIAA